MVPHGDEVSTTANRHTIGSGTGVEQPVRLVLLCYMAETMGLATDVSNAVSDGVNWLYALLAWLEGGGAGDPPIDPEVTAQTMDALVWAFREVIEGGRLEGQTPLGKADLARAVRLNELVHTWMTTGDRPADVVTLAEQCVESIMGAGWRTLRLSPGSQCLPPT